MPQDHPIFSCFYKLDGFPQIAGPRLVPRRAAPGRRAASPRTCARSRTTTAGRWCSSTGTPTWATAGSGRTPQDYPGYIKYTAHGLPDGDQRNHLRADTLITWTPDMDSTVATVSAEKVADGRAAHPRRAAQGHRRPGRGHRAAADRAVRRRPLPARRRAGPGQDAAGQHAGARSSTSTFKRIQFTPDLMPADITGTEILEETGRRPARMFSSCKGPIFANIILADEINRTPPKTQAALLEAMQEHQVTAGGRTLSARASRSSCWRRRTRSSRKAPTRCPRRSSTASCSTSSSTT